ncbi:MAG: HAMP domain-containing histidine kinase [Proteobacteria bacterium]|nr:HAMP domain-containing histidine kinase [Pseudomonadota bacterium]
MPTAPPPPLLTRGPVIRDQARRASPGAYYLLEDASGHVVAGNMRRMAPILGVREWTLPSGMELRGRGVATRSGSYLLVGLAATDLRELQHAIGYAFLWVVFGTLALGLVGGSVMSFSLLGRVEAISRASRRIVAGHLEQRITVRGTNDEFDHLATSLNAMLDRIQALMEGMRQISSDIAHDLHTPLSRHRQRLELALLQGRSEHELRTALEASVADVDSILETFSALLRIARLEAGADPPAFAMIDLGGLAENVVDAYRAVAEERAQTLTIEASRPASVQGSRALLTQLLANLIENALRHTPSGTAIAVSVETVDGATVLSVRDDGPGIPEEARLSVFRPFYRLEASRTTPGTGLGLSLVRAVTDLHNGRVMLSDNHPGLCVQLFFGLEPAAAPEEPDAWSRWSENLLRRYLPERHASQAVALAAKARCCGEHLARHAVHLRTRWTARLR